MMLKYLSPQKHPTFRYLKRYINKIRTFERQILFISIGVVKDPMFLCTFGGATDAGNLVVRYNAYIYANLVQSTWEFQLKIKLELYRIVCRLHYLKSPSRSGQENGMRKQASLFC